jgi:hAT family C-terminal dimerisation region
MLISVSLQIHAVDFPILTIIAHNILAIPGVSISVEWLFSSSKHTLSDSHSAMTAESASKTVVAREWLKKGLGVGVN